MFRASCDILKTVQNLDRLKEIQHLERDLGVREFMVLTAGGSPIFHFSKTEERRLDELLSGFLSAITSFASEFGEKSIQSLSFEGSELLYEQFGSDNLFIFLVEAGSSENILRAVLRDLSKRFLSRYETELRMNIPVLEVFMDFKDEVHNVFTYYKGVLVVTSSLSSFVTPQVVKDNMDIAIKSGGFLDEFHRDFGGSGNRILSAIDGETSIHDMSRNLSVPDEEISKVVEYLAIRGLLKISKLCPVIKKNDSRFDAYLDLIGLPNKDYQLLERAKILCNGDRPLVDVSEKLGVVPERLHEVLEKLGDEVRWNLVEVSGLIDEPKE
jgi:hypothetical protein